ncbi:hypothetical protein AN398_04250 [Corynebacterium pseudotuberculosis]|uniref:alpha/beta hydrolase n=1 Tax=Corynebacterium pseudotuberculosis TaxID=1719 RepID=UPI000737D339|nr:alpha/beta hydrolase family protein [Corynebacterium pseudotuberculosis]ALU21382.1 hypothetical protein AN398_04250 [Corynebacterium pseudotuberculosis]ANH23617.1 Corynomycolyl transferase [Corynebacterium pseudotuberculosis]
MTLSHSLGVAALCTALVVTQSPAHASASSAPASSSASSIVASITAALANSPGSSDANINKAAHVAQSIGFPGWRLPSGVGSSDSEYPLPTNPNITESKVLSRTVDPTIPNLERWVVASPAMKRNVEVVVRLPKDTSTPSPALYLLDGIGGMRNPGWIREGGLQPALGDQNVTVVMPTQALSSLYSDWVADDPALGHLKWETFITKELTKLIEDPAQKLNFNGKRAIGGLSMGAIGAVNIANQNPDMFKGVFGISGCYATQEPVGRITTKLIVESRGGNVQNMWGPDGSELWKRHDVPSNPEGLRNMAVYLSSADGGVLPSDIERAAGRPFYELPAGVALEQGTLHCTKLLDSAMRARGMNHQVVDLVKGGVHDWPLFNRQLRPAWDAIKGALY